LKSWMRPSRRSSMFPLDLIGAKTEVRYRPYGSVGVVVPWNFPFNLCFAPLASIFAAGNSAVIKPSELTPKSSELLNRLVDAYFSENEVAVIGGGINVGKVFVRQKFDHLLFTGSGKVAKGVMRAAADNLVPLTLELGGKSPVIISSTADLDITAKRVIAGKTINAGQICLAPDYVLIPRVMLNDFVTQLKDAFRELFPSIKSNSDYSSLINKTHKERLLNYLEDAKSKGGTIVALDSEEIIFEGKEKNKVVPALVLGATESMMITDEEIFGPILPIIAYDSIEEAIEYVQKKPAPLACYYFGEKKTEIDLILKKVKAGSVTINDVMAHYMQNSAPFGGVGASGIGSYHGKEGFINFSHSMTVYKQTRIDGALKLLRPPFGNRFRRVMGFLVKKD